MASIALSKTVHTTERTYESDIVTRTVHRTDNYNINSVSWCLSYSRALSYLVSVMVSPDRGFRSRLRSTNSHRLEDRCGRTV